MRKSTNFNLNLVEGSDLVNPLVQDVPNYEAIDEQMYKNECNSIGIATELKSGTVHALTRTIPNAPMFRFKATSNFTAGDTFTVDGIQVSALTPNGETLASNSYIIGSEVLCVLRETLLTVYVSGGTVTTAQDSEKLGGQLPEYYGTAENVSTALETAQSANQLTLTLQQSVTNINNNLAGGQISFSVVAGEPYVKVGADSPRPFSSGVDIIPFSFPLTGIPLELNTEKTYSNAVFVSYKDGENSAFGFKTDNYDIGYIGAAGTTSGISFDVNKVKISNIFHTSMGNAQSYLIAW